MYPKCPMQLGWWPHHRTQISHTSKMQRDCLWPFKMGLPWPYVWQKATPQKGPSSTQAWNLRPFRGVLLPLDMSNGGPLWKRMPLARVEPGATHAKATLEGKCLHSISYRSSLFHVKRCDGFLRNERSLHISFTFSSASLWDQPLKEHKHGH